MLPYGMFVFRCPKLIKYAFTGSRVLKAAINTDHMTQEQVYEEERNQISERETGKHVLNMVVPVMSGY